MGQSKMQISATIGSNFGANQQASYRFLRKMTDANIDESCNRIHYGSNWVVCVVISISKIHNCLLKTTNTGITP